MTNPAAGVMRPGGRHLSAPAPWTTHYTFGSRSFICVISFF